MGVNGPSAHLEHLVDGVDVQQLAIRVGGVGISSNVDSRCIAEAPAARAVPRDRAARAQWVRSEGRRAAPLPWHVEK